MWKPIILVRRGLTDKDDLLEEVARVARAVLQLAPAEYSTEARAIVAADKAIIYVVYSRDLYAGTAAGLVSSAEEVAPPPLPCAVLGGAK